MSNAYFQLSSGNFFQDWSNTGLISSDNNWGLVPSIQGFNGGSTSAGTNPQLILTEPVGQLTQVFANKPTPNTFTSGGVAEFDSLADPTVALQGSGSARFPSLVLYLDASGQENVTLQFDARDIDGSGDNAAQSIAVQYRVGSTGTWTNLPAGAIADASTGPNLATLVTHVNVQLPPACNNQAQVEVRIITADASGSDEWIGIDNISVTSSALPVVQHGSFSVDDVSHVEGNSGTTDYTFTVTRSGGSAGAVTVDYAVTNGTTDATDLTALSGTLSFADGELTKTVTISVNGDVAVEGNETFTLQLSNATGGASIFDASGTGTITNDDFPPIANVWINEFHYDPSSSPETGEFVEIAGTAGIDLTGYRVVLYNGNGGAPYAPTGGSANGIALSGVLADSANGFGFQSVLAPGLQNGSPDGIALVDPYGRVVQFLSYEGTMTALSGPAAGMTSTDIARYEENATPGTSLQLAGTGSAYADFTWTHSHPSTSGGANDGQSFLSGTDVGQIRIDNGQVVEGDSGQATIVFTLHRSGGFATEATVAYSLGFGTADAADLPAGTPLSGIVTFPAGAFTATISVAVAGDTAPEYNETLFVTLGETTGNAVVADADAVGSIINDDPLPLTIMEIQGEGHWSAFEGQPVLTQGIVTALTATGFYMQDPNGDGNAATSDGVFVYTGAAPTVLVGDAVSVAGRVSEFGSDLPLTEINVNGTGFGVTVTSSGNALPDAVLVGQGGLLPPVSSIDDDGLTSFDPATDGADFWESLEGMVVAIDQPQVIANSNEYGETYVVASLGAGATHMNAEGGITISEGDFNPEMVQIDDVLVAGLGYAAGHTTGDQLGTVIGVMSYSFAHYELLLTEVPEVTLDVTPVPDVVAFTGDVNYLTIATYNVENLDPSDQKYDELADDIIVNLGSPDIIAIQEMQDNDGTGKGTDMSAAANAQGLIDAIIAAGGPTYAYVEIAPAAGTTGGEPNGNIRCGYLYQVDRVTLVEGSLQTISDPSYSNSREPLIATWAFQGQEITTINVHFYARSGSDPLWGADQPADASGDGRRTDQAEAVAAYIHDHLADSPDLNIAVLGDWNGFYFEDAVGTVEAEGLVSLQEQLLPEGERYSYIFEGNAQLIDNVLVTNGLLSGASIQGIHINANFAADAPSDHDPQVARLLLGSAPTAPTVDGHEVVENAPAGTVVGTAQATDAPGDTVTYSLADNGGGRFAIHATTGVITTTMALDHEALTSVSITVRATDSAGQFTDTQVLVSVTDINEAPVAVANLVNVSEDATSANLWATLLANDSDPDAGDSITIQSVNTSGTLGHVLFDAATQTLRYIADHDSFDALAVGASANDTFTYTIVDSQGLTSTQTVTMKVTGIADGSVLIGTNSIDTLRGTAGEDTLIGRNGADKLYGLDGHDRLEGGYGNDHLSGGSGNDTLIGGQGNDRLIGGEGHDTFVFGNLMGSDTVVDFDAFADQVRLADGQAVRSSASRDVDGDGHADLLITLTHGGTITLLGVEDLSSVHFDGASSSASAGARSMGWAETASPVEPMHIFADAHHMMMLNQH